MGQPQTSVCARDTPPHLLVSVVTMHSSSCSSVRFALPTRSGFLLVTSLLLCLSAAGGCCCALPQPQQEPSQAPLSPSISGSGPAAGAAQPLAQHTTTRSSSSNSAVLLRRLRQSSGRAQVPVQQPTAS